MTTQFPAPATMAELSATLVRVIGDMQSLRHDLYGAAGPVGKLFLDAHDYAREVSWPAQFGVKNDADDVSQDVYRSMLVANEAVQRAENALREVATATKRTAQHVAEAEAQRDVRAAEGARLRG